jgi:membrane protease YdiL (CAAX protease family)
MGLGKHRAVLASTLLFAFCHVYEGPWGFLNAALSGVILAFLFLRFRSLHGIAIAHAMYNIFVYALGAVLE